MNLFRSKTLSWWQVGIIKGAVLCIGIAIGAYWSNAFVAHVTTLVSLGVVLGIIGAVMWLR